MKRGTLRILVLLWLGWYLSGPVAETFDFWDAPSSEFRDVIRNAGGLTTLLAAVFCIGVLLHRKFRLRSHHFPRRDLFRSRFALSSPRLYSALIPAEAAHSPPLPLRI
jgi:hypothetical protein